MVYANDDDIFGRALLRLLCPDMGYSTQQAETDFRKRFRRRNGSTAGRTHNAEWIRRPTRILVLEILSTCTLSVYWSDAQTGHYQEQIWCLVRARKDGFCALSGSPILEGDDVYHPRRRGRFVPANWDRMILASEVSQGAHGTSLQPGSQD